MRLTCPNCGAQYEVPDEVIPETGRDVQCSNCGETWFQAHPDRVAAGEAADDDAAGAGDTESDAPDWPDPEDDGHAEPGHPPAGGRRELDPDTASLLREEAEREARARAAEARGGLETQPDLGLSEPQADADRRSYQARARMERLRGGPAPEADADAGEDDIDPGSRRDLLPDIDEINSTIASEPASGRPNRSARDGSRVSPAAGAGGFGRGMRMAILLALIATALYMFAPRIADAVPALGKPLDAYVAAVDRVRAMLNEQVARLVPGL